jgi:TrmH family RNA methyltransferase
VVTITPHEALFHNSRVDPLPLSFDYKFMVESSRITSRQNPQIKNAVRLRGGHERRRQQQFIIDGAREIARALDSDIHPLKAFICDELCQSSDCLDARKAVETRGAEVFQVSRDVYAKLAFGDRAEGMVVVAETPRRSLADLQLPANPLVAVLEGVEKPGNVGAILRSADAAGVHAVIVADGRTDLYNPNTIRASLGTVFRQNICEASSADAIEWLLSQQLAIMAARPDATTFYTDANLRSGVAIVLGSESNGLTGAWNAAGITAVRLPMHGLADSLNVSTTAAVLLYEALRQRG